MRDSSLHRAQSVVLETLRHGTDGRYSAMRRHAGMESDVFKFHIRTLLKLDYIQKLSPGHYALTPSGKEFANNLDKLTRSIQKQPKLSILMIASKSQKDGEELYLLQQRKRQPYWDFWGILSGPAQWGAPFEVTAEEELFKQTGMRATAQVISFVRQQDHSHTNRLLEDRLFVIMKMTDIKGELQNTWPHGDNEWLTLGQLESKSKYFPNTFAIINKLKENSVYEMTELHYSPLEY